jgi:hypothetical protein
VEAAARQLGLQGEDRKKRESVWVEQLAEQRCLCTHLGVVPQSHWAARPQTTNICVSWDARQCWVA